MSHTVCHILYVSDMNSLTNKGLENNGQTLNAEPRDFLLSYPVQNELTQNPEREISVWCRIKILSDE